MAAADPLIDRTIPSLAELREFVRKMKDGKAPGFCNTSAEMLKAGCEACDDVCRVAFRCHSSRLEKGMANPIWKEKTDQQDYNNYHGVTLLSVPDKVIAHLLFMRI